MSGDASPALLMDQMRQLEADLARLQNDWADAEQELIRRHAQVERLKAPKRLAIKLDPFADKPKRPTKEDLDALVLQWLWDEHGELMEAHVDADARTAACRVIYKCAERALSSKQSRLSADVRLQGAVTP